MTPREHLLLATPRDPAPLGLRSLAAVVAAAEARGVVVPGIDAEHATDDDARHALPGVLRATLDGLDDLADDAHAAHVATGHGHRDVAALHRTTRESCRALAFELHAAARVARVPIAAAQPRPQRLRVASVTEEP